MAIEKNMINQLIHDRQAFTVIINDTINNIRDGFALGIYTYLASKPPGWVIVNKQLQEHFGVGRDMIKLKIKYLRDIGAITIIQPRLENGDFGTRKTILHGSLIEKNIDNIMGDGISVNGDIQGEIGVDGFIVYDKTTPIKERYIQNKDLLNISCAKEQENPSHYQETYYQQEPDIKQKMQEQKDSEETFETFWAMYPVKKAKSRAQAAWYSQRCHRNVHMILSRLDEQKRKDRQFLTGFPMHPDKYIHEERWNDEITPMPTQTNGRFHAQSSPDWAKDLHLDII